MTDIEELLVELGKALLIQRSGVITIPGLDRLETSAQQSYLEVLAGKALPIVIEGFLPCYYVATLSDVARAFIQGGQMFRGLYTSFEIEYGATRVQYTFTDS
jgi:hypothetical protein